MPPIVLVAPRGLPATLELALELIDAYVLRTAGIDELSCAVEEVRQGRSYLSPSLSSTLDRHAGAERSSPLTDRELTVVKLIALGHHNREIAHTLGLSVRTVESHRSHALYKLQLTSRTQLVHWALREHVI
jgi:DNA-binding NarL/FixJ family response regulator